MPGTYQYDVEIESNVAKLLSDMKQVQDRLDTVEGREYTIKLNIDEKKLSNVISNLEKMLDSLSKGTGDFKQFENLSKELSSIVSEVQSLSKAFGKVDDSGAKTLLSSIQNIDKSLSKLSQNILNVNKNMGNMGDDTSGAVKQVENITNESKKAASALEDVAKAQEKINGQKTNISSGSNSTIEQQNQLQEELKETRKEAEKTVQTVKEATSTNQMKDAFQPENDTSKMAEIKDSTNAASQAKEDFVKANKDVQSSIDGSENPLKTEADLMDQIAKSARDAAEVKKEFVEANKQVKDSADKTKDRYANRSKISDDDFLNNSNKYSTIANEKLNSSGYSILGNTVSTDLVNGLVKVTAKIKDADGVWKTFSAKIDADGNMFEQRFRTITKGINKLDAELANFGKDEVKTSATDEQVQKFKELSNAIDDYIAVRKRIASGKTYANDKEEADKLLSTINEIMGKADGSATILSEKQLADAQDRLDKIDKTVSEINQKGIQNRLDKLSSYDTKLNNYQATANKFGDDGWTSPQYLENVEAVKTALNQYREALENLKADPSLINDKSLANLDEYESSLKEAVTAVQGMTAAQKGYTKLSGQKTLSKINQLLESNSNMSKKAKDEIKAWYNQIASGNPSKSLDVILARVQEIVNAEIEAGRGGKSMIDAIKEKAWYGVAGAIGTYFGFNDIIQYGQQTVSTIIELDTALVDLKKTTSMSSSELENFYYDSNSAAKQMGVTTKEIIEQASSWSRLGYSTKEAATEMAQLSSQFASISPGMTTDEAQSGLVSIMKAWDIDYSDVKSEIMDLTNALGNSMAESNQDIVEGMERSAAALAAVGTSTEDSFALFSGIQEVLQNAEKSGTSLRSVALRLRSFDETTEEYSDDLANITGELVDLTKTAEHAQGVSIFKDGSTTEFKSLVDYFREIANIWDEMSQKQQNDFLLKAFGRTQAQAGAALIQNFKGVEKALSVMDDAAGSSDREMSTIESSLEYKINALKETWVGTVQELVDRGDVGKIVDGLTKISETIGLLINNVGILGSIGLGSGLFAGINNVGILELY